MNGQAQPVEVTAGSIANRRIRCWCDCPPQLLKPECRCEPADGIACNAELACTSRDLTMTEISGQPYQARLSAVPHGKHVMMVVPIEGECSIVQDGREARLVPGTSCLIRDRAPAEFVFDTPFRLMTIRFPEANIARSHAPWEQLTATRVCASHGAAPVLTETVKSLLANGKSIDGFNARAVSESVIRLVGAALGTAHDNRAALPSRIQSYHKEKIKSFVWTHLRDSHLDIAYISKKVGLSPRHIHRLFASEPQTLMQWIWNQRLDQCHQEISREQYSRRSIGDIALSWGFNDHAHFSRTFRKRFGVSPRDVRGTGIQVPTAS